MNANIDLEEALQVARRAVEHSTAATLPHFERGVIVETKPDRSPVTAADRASESAILRVIREAYPDHDVLAEESGAHGSGSRYRWIVDPLDGTRGFTRGGTFWGPLIALEREGEVVVGAMGLPAVGEVYSAAKGMGCFRGDVKLHVSVIEDWADATVSVGELQNILKPPHGEAACELIRTAASTRGYGDLMGFVLVLTGRAEVWIEAGVKIWDLAAAKILIEEAGGRFSDFSGQPVMTSGNAVGSNGRVHEHVLALLSAGLPTPR